MGADQERKDSAAEKGTTTKELLTVEPVTIYEALQGRYIRFVSDLDISNDGSGPDYDDPSYQSQTAYYNDGEFLNADEDKYIVFQAVIK